MTFNKALLLFSSALKCEVLHLLLQNVRWKHSGCFTRPDFLLTYPKHHNQPGLSSSSYTWSPFHSNKSLKQSELRTMIPLELYSEHSLRLLRKARAAMILFPSASIDANQLQPSRQRLAPGLHLDATRVRCKMLFTVVVQRCGLFPLPAWCPHRMQVASVPSVV